MISTILISALLSLLNTDGLDKNNSLLTAVWPEFLWALHVFWGRSMTGWCDAYEVRFQIPPGPVSFASRNTPHIVCIWNSIWQTLGCHRSLKVRNKPPAPSPLHQERSPRITRAETREDDEEESALKKRCSLSTKSSPSEFPDITRTAQKRGGNKKE